MDATKHRALDIAIQHARRSGFLLPYTLPVLKRVNKQVMRTVMTTIRAWLGWHRWLAQQNGVVQDGENVSFDRFR